LKRNDRVVVSGTLRPDAHVICPVNASAGEHGCKRGLTVIVHNEVVIDKNVAK